MATTYRYLLADLRTNQILAEIPLTGVQFTSVLNQIGILSGRILLTDPRLAGYDLLGSTEIAAIA